MACMVAVDFGAGEAKGRAMARGAAREGLVPCAMRRHADLLAPTVGCES